DEAAPADKQCKQEPAQVTYSTSAVSSTQEVLYINGNGTYSYHSYRGLGGGLLNLNDASSSDLQPTSTTATTQHCIPGTTNVQSPSSSGLQTMMAQLVAQGLPPYCSPLPAGPSRGCALPALPCFSQASYMCQSAFLVLCMLVLQMLQPCWRQGGSWGNLPGQVLLTSKDQHDHADLQQGEEY
ncbi:hypothetical protein EK904_007498, partial [Melospiza melodia maxima]